MAMTTGKSQSSTMPDLLSRTKTEKELNFSPFEVVIPDMLSSIMSPNPRVNPHYQDVKKQSDAWISEIFGFNEEKHQKIMGLDCALLGCLWVPDADEYVARLISDWLQWAFLFDDIFDDGILKEDPEEAKKEIEATTSLLTDAPQIVSKAEHPIRYIFYSVWERIKVRLSTESKNRYRDSNRSYCDGVLGQVDVRCASRCLDLKDYIDFRWRSIGVFPVFQFIELEYGIHLSDDVLTHPSIKELEHLIAKLVFLANDVISFKKEQALHENYFHNIINVLCREGMSVQQAMDCVGEIFVDCYRKWYVALADVPIYGETVDRELQKYIEGCRNIALGNLHWHFTCDRYLGAEGLEIQKTRVLKIEPIPSTGPLGNGTTDSLFG